MPIALGSAYGEIEINTSGAEQSVKGLAAQMADVGKTLSLGVSAPLLGVAATALKSAGDFEQAMNQMQVISGATGDQMKEMQALALKLGADTSFSAGEAAQGLLELSKAGLSAEQAMKAIPGVMDLAAAGDLSVAQAAEIASNALNSFHLPADKAKDVANLFAAAANASSIEVTDMAQSMAQASAVAASYGQSIETASTAIALLGNNGLKGSDAGTSLKTMLSRLAAPTEEAAALMKQLGVNVYDAQGKMRPLNEIMVELQKGLHGTMTVTEKNAGATSANSKQAQHYLNIINQTKQKLADYQSGVAGVAQSENAKKVAIDRLNRTLAAAQAEYQKLGGVQASTTTKTVKMTDEIRNQALYTLFGSDAIRAANILLKEGATGWDKMSAAVNKEGVAQDVANARMKGFNGAIEYVKGSIDSFLIETALPFLDSFSWLIRYVGDAVTGLGKLPDPLKNAALAFLAVLAVAGPVLLAITGVGAVLGALLSPVGLVVLAVAALAAAWASDFGGIREKTQAAINAILPYFDQAKEGIFKVAGALKDFATGSDVSTAWTQLKTTIGEVKDSFAGLVSGKISFSEFATQIKNALSGIPDMVRNLFGGADFQSLKGQVIAALGLDNISFAGVIESLKTFGQKLSSAITDFDYAGAFAGLKGTVSSALGGIDWSTITASFDTLKTWVSGKLGSIDWSSIAATFTTLTTWVSNKLNSIDWSGVTTTFDTLKTQVNTALGGIDWSGITGALGSIKLPTVTDLATSANTFRDNILQSLTDKLKTLDLTASLTGLLDSLTKGISSINFKDVGKALGDALSFVLSPEGLKTTLAVAVAAVAPALAASIAGIKWIMDSKNFDGLMTAMLDAIKNIDWGQVASSFGKFKDAVVKALGDLASGFTEGFKMPAWIEKLTAWKFPDVSTTVAKFVDWKFPALPQPLVDLLTWAWPEVPQVISDLLDWEFPDVPKVIDNLLNFQWPDLTTPDWIQSFVDAINALINWSMPDMNPFNAGGNSYFAGGMTHLNERGRELVAIPADQAILPAGSRIYTNGQANRMLAGGEGGGNLINIEKVYVTNQQDIHALAWQVDNLRRRQAGR